MKGSEFITEYANKLNISKKQAESLITTIISTIKKSLEKNEKIEIRGFGTFLNKKYESYTGINPKTLEKVKVGKKYVPTFKSTQKLKDKVNNSN